ncbi:hypothetical protein HZB02_00205 [Candidatus Woesearchaeota archaeon]|nr:hypothetical protein [Candidatus Woesearchaeota archaeon]
MMRQSLLLRIRFFLKVLFFAFIYGAALVSSLALVWIFYNILAFKKYCIIEPNLTILLTEIVLAVGAVLGILDLIWRLNVRLAFLERMFPKIAKETRAAAEQLQKEETVEQNLVTLLRLAIKDLGSLMNMNLRQDGEHFDPYGIHAQLRAIVEKIDAACGLAFKGLSSSHPDVQGFMALRRKVLDDLTYYLHDWEDFAALKFKESSEVKGIVEQTEHLAALDQKAHRERLQSLLQASLKSLLRIADVIGDQKQFKQYRQQQGSRQKAFAAKEDVGRKQILDTITSLKQALELLEADIKDDAEVEMIVKAAEQQMKAYEGKFR